MTKKIGVSLPDDTYRWIQSKIEQGSAESVSGLITQALERDRKREELHKLLDEWSTEIGETTAEEQAWVEEAVAKARTAARHSGGTAPAA